ncbi:putative cytochrome P450 monooxygenase [Aspergillus pseudodeflectus]|uniref:Cytochrome P450 monooxygenase n=1 Tax=Aspergillus pseudodeflectus TaxID=176178 RepID=A0ABR4L652_9EURO
MAFSFLAATATLLVAFYIYKFFSFLRFYRHARQTGFPVFVSPVFSKSIPWMILGPALQPVYKKYLPHWIFDRLEVCAHGWEFRNKRAYHDRLGDVFILVTPDECSVWIADPTLALSMLQRRNDFPQAPIVAKIMGFLGSNVFCANGDEWKRHRRMFASNLDERISRTVWTESKVQAQDMFKYIVDNPGNQTLDGLKSVAINVIGQAGFSQKEHWTPGLRARLGAATTGKAAYFETLSLITQMFLEAALLPTKFMKLPIMSRGLQLLGYHMERTPEYVQEVLNEERNATEKAGGSRSNFLSLLLQLSDEDRRSGQSQFSLSDDEISGSLFIFTTAGYETTANTMGYSVSFLAAYPQWQDWIREELHGLSDDPSTWKYEEVFPKCRRTLALMLETLRLFPPVLHTTRAVLEPQELIDATGKTHLLMPPMDIYACQLSLHLDRRIWGDDADEFRPSRWIDEAGQLITPEKGTYIPWSGGPRICPGMKMSQVEFVATMATLFRNGKCEPLPTDGVDSPQLLRERLLDLTRDSVSKLALSMRNPDGVQLRWTAV